VKILTGSNPELHSRQGVWQTQIDPQGVVYDARTYWTF
jgi:hypothetical protein